MKILVFLSSLGQFCVLYQYDKAHISIGKLDFECINYLVLLLAFDWLVLCLQKLTGGTLLSRNKEFIVFYRGNDFLPSAVTDTLKERRKLRDLQQDEEEQARKLAMASASIMLKAKASSGQLVAGTLAETMAATARWGNQLTSIDVEKMMRDSTLSRHASLVKHLQNKFALVSNKHTVI